MTKEYYYQIYKKRGDKEELKFSRNFTHYSIYIYDINTGKSTKVTKELPIENPVVWSPDDRYLSYNDRTFSRKDIYILDLQVGKSEKIPNVSGRVMTWISK